MPVVLVGNNKDGRMSITIPQAPSGKPVKPLGVVWYASAQDYAAVQAMCPDMDTADFATWEQAARAALETVAPGSQPRVQVAVEPVLFQAWCTANRTTPAGPARQRYVHDAVEEAFTRALRAHKAGRKNKRA